LQRFSFAFLGLLAVWHPLSAQLQVQAAPSLPAPQPVGAEIVFTFSATDAFSVPGVVNFRLEVAQPQSAAFIMVRDFEVANTFSWARNLAEGNYQIRVTARDSNHLTQPAQLVFSYGITSRVAGSQPVVSATTHPLVALFSSPVCPVGHSVRVVFQASGSTAPPYKTNFTACNGKTSVNILIGGMLASTAYAMHSQVGIPGGVLTDGPTLTWTTGGIPSGVVLLPPHFTVPFGAGASQAERLSLLSFSQNSTPLATNTGGKVVWYYAGAGAWASGVPATTQIMRLLTGGKILGACSYPNDYTGTGVFGNQTEEQALQIIDLTGHVVQETNVDRVNEQLLAMSGDPISSFNHDARLLPDGNIVAIGTVQRILPAGTQGSAAPIDILGTVLVELDRNFQVVWFWNSFDHSGGGGQLDMNRAAPLNEQCTTSIQGTNGCPPVLLSSPANDWLHTNTVQYQPGDGSLVVSIRNQDWVAKIDYGNGTGTGNILWIMGQDGSFAFNNLTGDPWPWFSHQHDVEFQSDGSTVTIFDNGNTRVTANGGDSRGYVLDVNESGLQVTPRLLFDTGYYAVAQGSAQELSNGDYEFMGGQIVGKSPAGLAPKPSFYEQGAEVTPAGVVTYSEAAQSQAYRLWRMTDFYNVPTN
jgi:hypothetical protein